MDVKEKNIPEKPGLYKVYPESKEDEPKYYTYRQGKWYFKFNPVKPPSSWEKFEKTESAKHQYGSIREVSPD